MTHRMKLWLYCGLAFGSAILTGLVIGKTLPPTGGVDNPALVLPLVFAAACVALGFTWLWWTKTDELQQRGQLISWYWGGTIGAVIWLVGVVTLTGRHSDLSMGAGYLFLAQGAGFFLFWLAWKIRGLGPTE